MPVIKIPLHYSLKKSSAAVFCAIRPASGCRAMDSEQQCRGLDEGINREETSVNGSFWQRHS